MRAVRYLPLAITISFAAIAFFWPSIVAQLTYMGHPLPENGLHPQNWRFSGESRFIPVENDSVHAWWLPASEPSCGTVLFLHGNAGNLASQAGFAREFHRHGLDVLIIDYRGYGASGGTASEAGLRQDARAAYRHLNDEQGLNPNELIIAGHSLGSAVAVDLAASSAAAGVVLAAPFTSFEGALRARLPWFPTWMLRWNTERHDAATVAASVEAPVLAVASSKDVYVPLSDSEALAGAFPNGAEFVLTEADHNRLLKEPAFHKALEPWLRKNLSCRGVA